jgi:hypothetical protein
MKKSLLLASLTAVALLAGCGGANVEFVEEVSAYGTGEGVEVKIEEKISDVEKDLPMDMEDFEIGIAIHHMSHQKVIANTKWGEMPLTQERVERLIEVMIARDDLKNEATYFAILKRWRDEDFSNVMQEHNLIWDMQGGTFGRSKLNMSMMEKCYSLKNILM